MQEGCYSHQQNETQVAMDRVLGRRVLSGKSISKLDRGASRIFLRYRAIKWFEPGQAIDYNETLVSIVKPRSHQTTFAFRAVYDHETVQKGDQTAFLQGDIGEQYYTENPPGRIDGTGHVCKPKNHSTV